MLGAGKTGIQHGSLAQQQDPVFGLDHLGSMLKAKWIFCQGLAKQATNSLEEAPASPRTNM